MASLNLMAYSRLWNSPVAIVKKKERPCRICAGYRMANNVSKKDSYHLPRIEDTLDTLVGCEISSAMDLKKRRLASWIRNSPSVTSQWCH